MDSELLDISSFRNPLYSKAFKNLLWDGMFAFFEDGDFPIDNNLVERTIR